MTVVKIIQEFRDKDRFSKIYLVGDICEFDENRALSLISKGLAELIFEKNDDKPKRGRKALNK
jgi:hypothetical protein